MNAERKVEFDTLEEAKAALEPGDILHAVYDLDGDLVRYEINVPARVIMTDCDHWYSEV